MSDETPKIGDNAKVDLDALVQGMKLLAARTSANSKEGEMLDKDWVTFTCRFCYLADQKEHRDDVRKKLPKEVLDRWTNKDGKFIGKLRPFHFIESIPALRNLKKEHPNRISAIKKAAEFILGLADIDDEGQLIDQIDEFPTMASFRKAREDAGDVKKRAERVTPHGMLKKIAIQIRTILDDYLPDGNLERPRIDALFNDAFNVLEGEIPDEDENEGEDE